MRLPELLAALPLGFVRRRVFIWALRHDERQLARRLFGKLDRYDFTDPYWQTPVEFVAAREGNLEILEALFEKRPDLDVNAQSGDEPFLHHAATHAEGVRFLLQRGADPAATDWRGRTALHSAAGSSLEACRLLVEAGAGVDAGAGETGTALASAGDAEIAAFLLEQGANPEAADAGGVTPLMKTWSAEVAESLLAAGVDVNRVDAEGRHALSHAAQGRDQVVSVLAAAGADLNLHSNTGDSAMTVAICSHSQEYPRVVEALLAAGVDVERPVYRDTTPLAAACLRAQLPVIPILLAAGARVDARNAAGESILDRVRKAMGEGGYFARKLKKVEAMLLEAGAREGLW